MNSVFHIKRNAVSQTLKGQFITDQYQKAKLVFKSILH